MGSKSNNYLEQILEILTNSGLDYCIQNGYEDMPNSFPTDVDIFYRNANEKQIDLIVEKITKETKLLVIQKVAMGYYHFVYWLTPRIPEPHFKLELDFQSELSRKTMPHYFLPNKLLDRKIKYNGFFIPSPIDEIIYTIMRRTVKHNFTAKHLKTIQKAYLTNPLEIKEGLQKELPQNIIDNIIDLIQGSSSEDFEKYYKSFYEYVCSQSKKNTTINKRLSQWKYNILRMLPLRFFNPCGMDIALLAPDGGGKSTILEALKNYEIISFESVERKYIRPGMFQNIGQYKPNAQPEMTDNPNPHGRKPDSVFKSWIRFLIYLIDFTLGYLVKVVPLKWKRHLVVFDRYYYDYYVDMYRYHYSLPKWVPNFFSFIIPNPTITFVLYASADVIYNRKKELTLEETERQCEAFKKVASKVKNAILVDVDRPIEEIVQDIAQSIVDRRVQLTQKKLFSQL
ncbi:hypothetical protein [Bacteroides fluxus]|uniref:hypothetical protein n=1 Tax=Bacteroides fluxus TaxID=626930 RepID=UPI0026DB133A|nr:hypothetical protein [Bacteroides fluxus]